MGRVALLASALAVGVLYYHACAAASAVRCWIFACCDIETFRMSLSVRSLSRIAVGAMPFLLPMMFQLGFGMSAAQAA